MFCKHSLWLLKYSVLATLGGAVVLFLSVWSGAE